MKTISELLKEIFAVRRNDKPKDDLSKSLTQKENQEITNQPDLLTNQNSKENETEISEIAGNPELVATDIAQGSSIAKESGPDIVDREETEGQPKDSRSEIKESSTVETILDNPCVQEALKEAFLQGEKAGRNQMIEMKYFPKDNDGIPAFRGSIPKKSTVTEFFNIAKEA